MASMKIARLGLDRGPRYAVLDEDSDELLMQVASRLKIADVFERAVEAFDE